MDGIVVPKGPGGRVQQGNDAIGDVGWDDSGIASEYSVRRNDTRDVYEEEPRSFDEDRPSRLIPILGGLILFLLLTILYLVLR
jgi:hypothetical protein